VGKSEVEHLVNEFTRLLTSVQICSGAELAASGALERICVRIDWTAAIRKLPGTRHKVKSAFS
jgi:hypothetical protein